MQLLLLSCCVLNHIKALESFDLPNVGVVTLIPNDGGLTYLNGNEIHEPKILKTGSRIILGNNHVFRFTNPEEGECNFEFYYFILYPP